MDPAPRTDHEPFHTRQRWAGRLAFPLMIAAMLLGWQGVKSAEPGAASALPAWAWWTLGALAAVVAIGAVRLRHRGR